MKITILENEKVVETIQLDLSCLLFLQSKVEVSQSKVCDLSQKSWKFDRLKTLAIQYLEISVKS
jgi:hypothetical protein